MIVDLGESWSSPTYEVRDPDDVPTAATVTAVITLPDGTLATPTPVNPALGDYTVDYLSAQPGLHQVLVSATGGMLGNLVRRWQDTFTVEAARTMVSVEQALQHLRGTNTITEADELEQLRWLVVVATDAVERACSRTMVRRTLVEQYDGGRDHVRLRKGPVQSITSVTEHGQPVPSTDWLLDTRHDRLYRGSTYGTYCWSAGILNVAVTYVAGYTTPPVIARKVCLNGIQRMWQQSQQAPMPYLDDNAADAAIATTVSATLTPLEMAAWKSLNRQLQA